MTVTCDCGCRKFGQAHRMHTVTAEYRQLSATELRTRPVRRWHVLPECEAPFKRELNAMNTLRQLAELFQHRHWLVRFDNAHLVFRAQFLYCRRNKTLGRALESAAKVAAVFSAPEWLASVLTRWWKPKPVAA